MRTGATQRLQVDIDQSEVCLVYSVRSSGGQGGQGGHLSSFEYIKVQISSFAVDSGQSEASS